MIPSVGDGRGLFEGVKVLLPAARQRAEDNKDEGKRMSRNQNRIAKLIAVLGVFGLTMAFSVPTVSAQITTFSAASYSGRYGCNLSFDEDFFTAVYKYNPSGAGGYGSGGTLIGSLNNFVFPFNIGAPAGQFCTYFLQPANSVYTVDSTGVGNEILSWVPSVANSPFCPGAFIDETFFALSSIATTSSSGISTHAVVADRNLFGINPLGDAGRGQCEK